MTVNLAALSLHDSSAVDTAQLPALVLLAILSPLFSVNIVRG